MAKPGPSTSGIESATGAMVPGGEQWSWAHDGHFAGITELTVHMA